MSPLRLPSATLLRTQSDARLVALARDGWEPAFTALVERYRREILRACMRVLPEARAEDATQQVFMAAWSALRRGDEVREVRPWLHTIARNTALNALRVPGYDHGELAESLRASEAPQAELERREVMRATLTGLAALPDRQREALLRSAVEGASHAEIAAGLGIKEGAARQLVLRARTTLRGAATAVTPTSLLTWALTRAGDASLTDAVAGGGAAGATGLLAKAGVVAVVAGGAIAAPVAVHHRHKGGPAAAEAAMVAPSHARHVKRTATPAATATATATVRPARLTAPPATAAPVRTAEAEHHGGGPGPGGDDERRTPSSAGSGDDGGGHRGPGGGGGSDDDAATPTPAVTLEATATAEPTETVEPVETSNRGPGSSGSGGSSHDGRDTADHH